MGDQNWITIPCCVCTDIQMRLTFYAPHLMQRWEERKKMFFASPLECAKYTASFFQDKRLRTIFERVPLYSHVMLYIESAQTVFFFQLGTKYDAKEIKINTLYPLTEGQRIRVEKEDYCYILPKGGNLRFGKERKYFLYKTNT